MIKKILLLIFCSFSAISFGQILDNQPIDNLFIDWNRPDAPGGALGIVKDGQLIYSKGYGIADLEHDIEIKPSSVFYIGSTSKQFVAFSILLLEEQGKLNLDDKIQKYLPDFPEYGTPITIRHLIHHTSGVRDYLTLMLLKGKDYLDHIEEDEVYDLIKSQKELNFKPGEKYLYSNSCYFMLAMIIEKAAHQTLRKFAQEQIFDPLGMKNTLFYDNNRDLIKNRVFSYEKKNGEDGFNNLIMRFDLVGSGGMYSTVEDLYLWDQNFYNNKLGKGGQDIIKKMHTEGILNSGESSGYAFALNNGTYKGLKTVSHSGALAGYRTELIRFPDEKFSVIILSNRTDTNPTQKAFQVSDVVLKDKFINGFQNEKIKTNSPKNKDSKEKLTLKQVTGNYQIQNGGASGGALEITLKNDSLHVVQSWNKLSFNLVNTMENTYQIPNVASIQFVFSELKNNYAQTLKVLQDGKETIGKRKEKLNTSDVSDIEDYTGVFYSEELEIKYLIFSEDDKLKVKIANYDAQELSLNGDDTFISNGNVVRFFRSNGVIKGFELDAGRVTNLKFEKE